MAEPERVWSEENSATFIDLGRIYTPRREEIAEAFCDLIPAEPDDAFMGAELGTGAGWLSEAILHRYPRGRMLGLDGSEAMRATTAALLRPFGDRAEIRPFRLEQRDWLDALPAGLRCVVSSLVIHHLDGPGKQQLFADLFSKLGPGGALLICDVIEPANGWGRRHLGNAWDGDVARQSRALTGNDAVYDQFVADEWNMYRYPEEPGGIDRPSTTLQQLGWITEAGFSGVDVWWARAGHVLFGGYRPE